MKLFSNEVRIALVAIVAIIVIFFGMNFLKGLSLFSTGNSYCVSFDNVNGVSVSSPVYANGYRVGVVEKIDYDYSHTDHIVAVIGLNKQMQLRRGTTVEIESDFLGNVQLNLVMPADVTALLAPGDTIVGSKSKGMLAKAGDMVPQIQQMLPKLDSILSSVNALLADPALSGSLHNVENITASLTTTSQQLSLLTQQLNRQMPQMMQKADGVLANAEGVTSKLNALDLQQTMQRVDATLGNLQQTTKALNSKEGTLGLMLRDPQLYNSLSATVRSADSLLSDIKAHPKRYINVSVFGRKEK